MLGCQTLGCQMLGCQMLGCQMLGILGWQWRQDVSCLSTQRIHNLSHEFVFTFGAGKCCENLRKLARTRRPLGILLVPQQENQKRFRSIFKVPIKKHRKFACKISNVQVKWLFCSKISLDLFKNYQIRFRSFKKIWKVAEPCGTLRVESGTCFHRLLTMFHKSQPKILTLCSRLKAGKCTQSQDFW